jgi:hypothetical protein
MTRAVFGEILETMTAGAPRVFIRSPWAGLIVAGFKTVETAAHGLPERYRGRWLDVQNEAREIVGRVQFRDSFKYSSPGEFDGDRARHKVPPSSPYHYRNRARCYGWIVDRVEAYPEPVPSKPFPGQFRFSEL